MIVGLLCFVGFIVGPLDIHYGVFDELQFEDADRAQRFEDLIAEIRCPKCLNTNLAGSDAPIAADLRQLIYEKIREGSTDDEIRSFLKARYGEFVLYDPPLSPRTVALWILPVVLILLILWLVLTVGQKKRPISLSDDDKERLATLKFE